jgi:MoaA/NifB/PqqE/SkfB family radical SAM enzyme
MLYYPWWFFQCKILGRRKPLQSVIFITDRCNLHCRHCNVVKEGPDARSKSFAEVRDELRYCYDAGSRFVDFEGGEPHLWRDKEAGADIDALIDCAREMGFHSTTVTTNAWMPITARSDLIWVSLDGLEEAHDDQRGTGSFARAMQHIEQSAHPNLNVNMVVTNRNHRDLEGVARLVREHPHLRRMSFSFYVPYDSRDLLVPPDVRNAVIDKAIGLKKDGYPLMNSLAGLDLLRDPQRFIHKRQCWISNFIMVDGTRLSACPGEAAGVCEDCGFGMGAEMMLLFSLHPEMVKAGLSVRASS